MKLSNTFLYALSTIISGLLSVITLPILAWGFNPEDIARLVLLQVACMLVITFFLLGLDQSYVREYNESENKFELAKVCFTPGFVLLIFLSCMIFFFRESITVLIFGKYDLLLFSFFALSNFILFIERFFSIFLRMNDLVMGYAVTRVLPKIVLLGLGLLAFFYKNLADLNFLVFSQIISWLAAVVIMTFILKRTPFHFLSSAITLNKVKPLLRFGVPLMVSGFAFWGLTYLDRIMLSSMATLSDVAVYSIALSFAGAAIMVQQIFSVIWIPTLYKWVAKEVIEENIPAVNDLVQFLSFLVISLGGVFAWLAPLLLPSEYKEIGSIIVFCLMPPLFMLMSEVSGVGINIVKRTKILPFITFFALIINFLLNLFLIPIYGAPGAAIATVISVFSYLVVKTEASCYLWIYLGRSKQYFFSVVGFFISFMQYLDKNPFVTYLYTLIWGLYFLMILFSYRRVIPKVLYIFRSKVLE